MQTLSELRQQIELLMEYAVPESHAEAAAELLDHYASDIVALNLLHAFYALLPEGEDDWVRELYLLARRQGSFLLCAAAGLDRYLFAVTSDGAEFLGSFAEGVGDSSVLDFFGFANEEEFLQKVGRADVLEVYEPAALREEYCPMCQVAAGEYHTLGCPVEICPWCGGQLIGCSCRFTVMGVESLDSDEDVERFLELLEGQGRIPFEEEQRPGFLSEDDFREL